MITKQFKLTIELVPSTIWYSNIYNFYKKTNQMEKWSQLKEDLYQREGNKCWVCGKENTYLEAHEFFEYNDKSYIQKLVGIHHLCRLCHKIKHIGFWCYTLEGQSKLLKERLTKSDLIKHFCNINNCSQEDYDLHKNVAFKKWEERSKHKWKQDLGVFDPKEYGRNQLLKAELLQKTQERS